MMGRSLRGAIDAHCRECGACDAGANWREHVSCCVALSCPLWPVRPLSRSAPAWIASRERDDLPSGWCKLPFEDALSELRSAPLTRPHDAERLSCGARPEQSEAKALERSHTSASGYVAVMGSHNP